MKFSLYNEPSAFLFLIIAKKLIIQTKLVRKTLVLICIEDKKRFRVKISQKPVVHHSINRWLTGGINGYGPMVIRYQRIII